MLFSCRHMLQETGDLFLKIQLSYIFISFSSSGISLYLHLDIMQNILDITVNELV